MWMKPACSICIEEVHHVVYFLAMFRSRSGVSGDGFTVTLSRASTWPTVKLEMVFRSDYGGAWLKCQPLPMLCCTGFGKRGMQLYRLSRCCYLG